MIIIWGSSLYGKVDEIPGLGHVATKMGHLYYVPLIPMGSNFVTHQTSDGWQGASIGFSIKSVLMAWVRAFSIVAAIAGLISCISIFTDDTIPVMTKVLSVAWVIAAIAVFFVTGSAWARTATYERACNISRELGFDARLQVYIDLTYGQINDAEADRRMEALDSNLQALDNLDEEIHATGIDQRIETR